MKNSSLKKSLLQTVSGVALACMVAPAAHAVATNVGTSTTNSTATTVADIAFFFNTSGGTLTNTATITSTSGGAAVSATGVAAGTLTNSSAIIASGTAAAAVAGVTTLTNTASGLIQAQNAGAVGLSVVGTPTATVTNAGTINSQNNGAAVQASVGSTLVLTNSGSITNTGSGLAVQVVDSASSVSITNTGTIAGGTTVASTPSGTAISTANAEGAIAIGTGVGSATVTNTGGTIRATLLGANAINSSSPLTVTNSGTISAGNAAAIQTAASQHAATVITNSSSISSASITTGTIDADSSLTLTNTASGSITSTAGRAIDSAVGATIDNSGTISTTSGVAVYLAGTATNTITNSGTITGGATAIQTTGTGTTTITNTGTLTTSTSVANPAVVLESVVNLTNSGTITSSNTGATIQAGPGGATTTITNSGTIQNQQAGIALDINNTIGQITNTGTVSTVGASAIDIAAGATVTSGISNSGTIRGATNSFNNGGNAITFTNTGTMIGNVVLSNAGADIFNVNGGSITGSITGAGNNDTLNFNATNGFTSGGAFTNVATINVDGGSLTLNHAITGAQDVVVDSGATLNQNAAITAAVNVTVNGTLDADGVTTANAAQAINGNLLVGAGGKVVVGATDGGANDVVAVTGNAVLTNGATINLQTGTAQIVAGDTFQVITSAGMTGTATALNYTSSDNFITLSGGIAGNALTLTATTASTASAVSNLLSNNGITNTASLVSMVGGGAAGTNTTAATTAFSDLMIGLSTSDNATFQTLNGNINALEGQTLADALEDLTPNAAIIGGNTQAIIGGNSAMGNVVVARLDQARQTQYAAKQSGLAAGGSFGTDLQLWAQPYGTTVNQGQRNGIDGYDADVYGLLIGGDVQVDEKVRLGLSLGYSDTNVVARGSNGLAGSDIEGYNVNLYGSYTEGAWFVDALIGAGWNDTDTNRFNTITAATNKGSTDGNTYTARVGGGYNFDAGNNFTLTPQGYVQYTNLENDGYRETGLGAVNVGELENDSLVSSLGLKVAYDHETSQGLFVPYVQANWINENGDDDQSVSNTFVGGTTTFVTKSAGIERSAIHLGTGVDFYTDTNTKLGVQVDYLDRDDVKALSGALRVRMPF